MAPNFAVSWKTSDPQVRSVNPSSTCDAISTFYFVHLLDGWAWSAQVDLVPLIFLVRSPLAVFVANAEPHEARHSLRRPPLGPPLLVALQFTPAIPFLTRKKCLQNDVPHVACIVVAFAIPIIVNHILCHARMIDRLLDWVVRAVLDIGSQGVVLVLQSRHSAIVSRVAHKSLFTALDVSAADFIRVPVLLWILPVPRAQIEPIQSEDGTAFGKIDDFRRCCRHHIPALPTDSSHDSAIPSQACLPPSALAFQSQNDSPLPFWMSTRRPPALYAYSSPRRTLSSSSTSVSPVGPIVASPVLYCYYLLVRHIYRAKQKAASSCRRPALHIRLHRSPRRRLGSRDNHTVRVIALDRRFVVYP
ncbi:hypothetical protein C8F01DRAFT_1370713 [Mycena amicta]|nr:hypothetical protein C8F01DRAFT_1370713 [Mycena amicta]